MLMKLVTLLASSLVLTAFAGDKPKIEPCDVGHDKFVASAPAGFKVLDDKNPKAGARVTTMIAPDGSSVSILSIPAAAIPFFKGLPLVDLSARCISPLGVVNEVFAMYGEPNQAGGKGEL